MREAYLYLLERDERLADEFQRQVSEALRALAETAHHYQAREDFIRRDEEFDSKICRGIALTTRVAIMASVLSGKLPKVQSSYVAERVVSGYPHAATNIYMKDGTEYVFDWWPTLNPRNPLIS